MKFKVALILTMLVLASLISFPNRCGKNCDGRTMIVMTSAPCAKVQQSNSSVTSIQEEAAGMSPLLRIAVTL